MDINRYIYKVRSPLGFAKAFRLANTNYLLTTDSILQGVHSCHVFDIDNQLVSARIVALDNVACLGVLQLQGDLAPTYINYLPEIVEDSYDVSIPIVSDLGTELLTGYISNFVTNEEGNTTYYHSIELNTADLGSPVLNEDGLCIGINNSLIEEDEVLFYANPITNYLTLIAHYEKELNSNRLIEEEWVLHRCKNQSQLTRYKSLKEMTCCQPKDNIHKSKPKHADVSLQISKMLGRLNFDAKQSKMNKNEWEVKNGSAKISIVYHESKGLLIADAILANSKDTSNSKIYEYLLIQNYILEGLTFSVVDQDIILSMKLFDNYLEYETMMNLFNKLIHKADELDDVLADKLKN